jgi:hypothetical protein
MGLINRHDSLDVSSLLISGSTKVNYWFSVIHHLLSFVLEGRSIVKHDIKIFRNLTIGGKDNFLMLSIIGKLIIISVLQKDGRIDELLLGESLV